jgi:hypothetical protein
MSVSILKEFLLFDSMTWLKYGNMILYICKISIFPVVVFSLIADFLSKSPSPSMVFKRWAIAGVILMVLPTYYSSIVNFGFRVGDSILAKQKGGIISNWRSIVKRAEIKAKKSKEKVDSFTVITKLFAFDSMDLIEKGAAILILISSLLIKVIYSVVYYSTYSIAGIFCVLSIIPTFDSYLIGIFKSMLYLIITAILVALVLTFMNEAISFSVNSDGFLNSLTGVAKFLVLYFVLFGTLAIGYSIVNGKGAESWAGKMGAMLGAGLGYKTFDTATNIIGSSGKSVASTSSSLFKSGANSLLPLAKGIGGITSSPFVSAKNNIKKGIKSSIGSKTSNISQSNSGLAFNHQNSSLVDGRYESNFRDIASNGQGQIGFKSAINPVNHMKTSIESTKGLSKEIYARTKNNLGLPVNSRNLTLKEKAIFVANKAVNNGKVPTKEEMIKNQILASRITNLNKGSDNGKN